MEDGEYERFARSFECFRGYRSIESFLQLVRPRGEQRIGAGYSFNGESDRDGFHHSLRPVRQSIGDRVGDEAQEASCNYQLLRSLVSAGGYVGRHFRNDVQRVGRTLWKMVVRLFYVRRVEFVGRVFQHRFHTSSLLHQRGSLLRDRTTVGLSVDHDQSSAEHHAQRGLVLANGYQLPADIRRMVHHRETPRVQKKLSGRVRVPSEQTLCRDQFQCQFLAARDHHDRHVLQDL